MITIYPYNTLGHADHGWLNARHHFSFAAYYNPERVGFGALRVINDDIIKAGAGFDTHPHNDMEIITYVRQGAITHRDSHGNEGRTAAGDVQVMSAGTGIFHSEYNLESEDTRLYQIWIHPDTEGVKPQWASHVFPKEPVHDALPLLVGPRHSRAPLTIHQDAYLYAGTLEQGTILHQAITHQAYILVSHGTVTLDGKPVYAGDGAEVTQQLHVTIEATEHAEILVIDVPSL